jgi:hypothetical protein
MRASKGGGWGQPRKTSSDRSVDIGSAGPDGLTRDFLTLGFGKITTHGLRCSAATILLNHVIWGNPGIAPAQDNRITVRYTHVGSPHNNEAT